MPINVISKSGSAGWIPEIWAQEILARARNYMSLSLLATRDYSENLAKAGDKVRVPKPLTFSAQDIPYRTTESVQNLEYVEIALNKWQGVPIFIEDLALVQAAPDLLAAVTEAAAVGLAEAIESALFSLYTAAGANVGTAGTDVSPATITDAWRKLVEAKVPQMGRKYLVLSPKDAAALLASPQIVQVANSGTDQPLRRGQLPPLFGFEPYVSQMVPVANGTTYNLAFADGALALVTRPLGRPEAPALYAVVADPESRLSFRLTVTYQNTPRPGHYLNLDFLYGVAVLRPEWLIQVLG